MKVQDLTVREMMELILERSHVLYVPYQLCPKCNGWGKVVGIVHGANPNEYVDCDVCKGEMIIPKKVIE
jgi:hypothetical protein